MTSLALHIPLLFGFTTFLTLGIFYRASHRHLITALTLLAWTVIQMGLTLSGFYTQTSTMPPRFMLLLAPAVVGMTGLFISPDGRRYMDRLDPATLTLLHTVRIPVELVLFWLAGAGTIPELMTFEGKNFDILAGLSAPFVYYYGYLRKKWPRLLLVFWNILSLALLLNIVIHATLAAPSPFQAFAFDQPNMAILHFPFSWLPSVVVPIVIFAHLATLRQLFLKKQA